MRAPENVALICAAAFWLMVFQAGTLASAEAFPRPRGIYVLDSQSGTQINGVSMRDANIRPYDYVAGYALRVDWGTMEPAQDQFDFAIIDWNVRKLAAAGKKLSVLLINTDPAWIAQTSGVTSWTDSSLGRNRAVPWDSFLLTRFEIFLHALAEHTIDGVKFKDHPVLTVVNAGLPGANLAIRDPSPVTLRSMPSYSRANLTNAVLESLRATVLNFPSQFVQIGFWPVTDSQATPSLWEDLRQAILTEFDGVTRPRVGFWMENLSSSRPVPGQDPLTGRPNTTFGGPLFLSQSNTWANFQALTSWCAPFNNYNSNVANSAPADGMLYALTNYGSTYFELYVADIDCTDYRADFQMWNAFLFPPKGISISAAGPDVLQIQWESWPGGAYQMSSSPDLVNWSNAGAPVIAAGILTAWTANRTDSKQFFRLQTLP